MYWRELACFTHIGGSKDWCICTGWPIRLCKTSHWLQNKVVFQYMDLILKLNLSFDVNGRFCTTWMVTLYCIWIVPRLKLTVHDCHYILLTLYQVEIVTLHGRHDGLVSRVTQGQLADAESDGHADRSHDGEGDYVGEEEGNRGTNLGRINVWLDLNSRLHQWVNDYVLW